ncbi:MAG: Beta-galactosidase C-terminal domain [Roseiflexaceae bacterium]
MELALRETADRRLLFVLNHSPEARTIALPANHRYVELLSGSEVTETLDLPGYDVRILAEPL